jgi:hydroxymethylglutaryl-CoA reductase
MIFYILAKFPLALGTVGGLTSLHPFEIILEMLENHLHKNSCSVVVAGLPVNFAALRSSLPRNSGRTYENASK